MDHQRTKRLTEAVTVMGEAFRQKITTLTLRAFEIGTADLPIEDVERACLRAITECRFMPTVSELRRLAGIIPTEARNVLAWGVFQKAVREQGVYRSVDFDDPLINATVRLLGGWEQICEIESGEQFDTWLRKRFETTYQNLCETGCSGEYCRPLIGICDRDNTAAGYLPHVEEPRRIECGLPPHRADILRRIAATPARAPGRIVFQAASAMKGAE